MSSIPFIKMHGCGNDFGIFDSRHNDLYFNNYLISRIADRNKGIGCDQVIIIENSKKADCFMRIYNADASESAACGNATRCVAKLIMDENNSQNVTIETKAGILQAYLEEDGQVAVDMGQPKLNWEEIPLAYAVDMLNLPLNIDKLKIPAAVNMGNPHVVFFSTNIDSIELSKIGPAIENHKLFPERTNVNIAEIIDKNTIKLRVWERGVGETLACGSGACATLVAAVRKRLTSRRVQVLLKGGILTIEWLDNNMVRMIGEAVVSFNGTIELGSNDR